MSPPYSEVTVVSLPSSFMIVSSLTPSYSLLTYLFQSLGTVYFHFNFHTHLFSLLYLFKVYYYFFQHIFYLQMLSFSKKIFSLFKSLDFKLRGRYFILAIGFRRINIMFILIRYSCHHSHLSYIVIYFLLKKKSNVYPMFCYPIKILIIKIIIRYFMDKVSVYCLDPLNYWCS